MRIFILIFLSPLLLSFAPQGTVTHIVDGDTFDIGKTRIRLCGIDAPERSEPGFNEAKNFLTMRILNEPVNCRLVGEGTPCDGRSRKRSRKRLVAQCFHNGEDVATLLVRCGHARDWPRFSGGHYRKK